MLETRLKWFTKTKLQYGVTVLVFQMCYNFSGVNQKQHPL